jgi:protein TonB
VPQTVVALKPPEPVVPVIPPEPVKEVIAEATLPVPPPTPVTIPQATPVAATPPPTLAINAPPSPGARGDGSSATPGLDATTAHAQPGLLAKANYLKNPEPAYPPAARRRRQEGLVLLSVKVNLHGRAASVAVKQSSGFPLLDEAAMQAVGDWDFQPARIGTLAVESEIEVPVRFKLTQ